MQAVTVGIIGAGEMGSAVAKRLRDGACPVVVSVEGRSAASRQRLAALGISAVETALRSLTRVSSADRRGSESGPIFFNSGPKRWARPPRSKCRTPELPKGSRRCAL